MTGRVIGIVSSKGGVGKTTIVANLGVIFASEFDKKIVALDANLNAPNLGMYLGIVYPEITLNDVLDNKVPMQLAMHTHTSGLRVLPASWTADKVNIQHLKTKIKELAEDYDLILLDSAPGMGRDVAAVMDAADGLLIVTNPELPAVTTTLKTLKHAADFNVPIDGIILNRVRGKEYEMSNEEVAEALGIPVVAIIPEDEGVPKAISKWTPVALYSPSSQSSTRLKKLAANILGEECVIGLFARLRMKIASLTGKGTADIEREELDMQVIRNIEKLEKHEKKLTPPPPKEEEEREEDRKDDSKEVVAGLSDQMRRVMGEFSETEKKSKDED